MSGTVKLASSVSRLLQPTIVLIHGLDSAKDTWKGVLSQLAEKNIPAVAMDLRGHGDSPLGNPADFSVQTLVNDIKQASLDLGILGGPSQKIVLVGHSMGGRVVMEYAATHPHDICCLLIEDIDLTSRNPRKEPEGGVGNFDRSFETFEFCKSALVAAGYDGKRIEENKGSRIRQTPKGNWWSAINPDAQYLALKHVLASDHGIHAFNKLNSIQKNQTTSFPVHLFRAGNLKQTACKDVDQMTQLLPSMAVKTFEGKGHSIHREAADEFVKDLVEMWSIAAAKL